MANLHIPLYEFWEYTPAEIDVAFRALNEAKFQEIKLSWEQVRIQIYYSYLLTPTKKTKVKYETFKRDYLPLFFDEKKDYSDNPLFKQEAIDEMERRIERMNNFKKKKLEGTQK